MIGIIDSGIGGLTVLKALAEKLPDTDFIYMGDTARAPYGTKSAESVTQFAAESARHAIKQGAELIVVACHTASSVALDHLGSQLTLPLFNVVDPVVDQAIEKSGTKRIGVIATQTTVDSGIYESRIRAACPNARVFSAACPLLVPLVEEGWQKHPIARMIVKKYLHPLKVRQIDTLILGCTHYPLLTPIIQAKIGRRVTLVDPGPALLVKVAEYLQSNRDLCRDRTPNRRIRLFATDVTDELQKTARRIYKSGAGPLSITRV